MLLGQFDAAPSILPNAFSPALYRQVTTTISGSLSRAVSIHISIFFHIFIRALDQMHACLWIKGGVEGYRGQCIQAFCIRPGTFSGNTSFQGVEVLRIILVHTLFFFFLFCSVRWTPPEPTMCNIK